MYIFKSYAACKAMLTNPIDYIVTWGVDSIEFVG